MSSLLRRIARQVVPSQPVHVRLDMDGEPKRKPKARKAPVSPAERRAIRKARVAVTYRAPTRAERADAHERKMARKAARRG